MAIRITMMAALTALKLLVPERDNQQWMSFWVALGAGYFRDEGIDVQPVFSDTPGDAPGVFAKDDSPPVAVLPPPMYIDLIADKVPLRIVANLMRNDGINLLVRRSVMEERKLSPTAPVAERLRGLRGLRIGVAPGPVGRLRTLFRTYGMDVEKDLKVVIMTGHQQNEEFGAGHVDVLYSHTPYLERAMVQQDAMLLVNQSAGEVKPLAARQIHALATKRAFAAAQPKLVAALVRAIARAEKLIHADRAAAVAAIEKTLTAPRDHKLVETIVKVYEPAIPTDPGVSVEGTRHAIDFYPASKLPPKLDGIDLRDYVLVKRND